MHIFADESGCDGSSRYLVHGIVVVRPNALRPLREAILETCAKCNFDDEVKWSQTSAKTLGRDLAIVDLFYRVYGPEGAQTSPRFQALVVDQRKIDVKKYHAGDKDLCFYKLLYQLLLKRIVQFSSAGESVHIVLDRRNTRSYDLDNFRRTLNSGIRIRRPDNYPIVVSLSYIDSKREPLIQLADFLAGAICFHQNGRHLIKGASSTKIIAADYVAKGAKIPHLGIEDHRAVKFGLWKIQLQ